MTYFFKGKNDQGIWYEGSTIDYRKEYEYSYINDLKVRTETIGMLFDYDMNGKRIYFNLEGKPYDILISKNGTEFTLGMDGFTNRLFIARVKNGSEIKQYPLNDVKGFYLNECELIGNIWDM